MGGAAGESSLDPDAPNAETANSVASESTQTVVIEPPRGAAWLNLRDLWEYRELLYFLVWRDVKVRYKQTVFGVTWMVIQPVAAVAIFTIIFGWLAKLPSDGMPYPVFAYAALLPWNFFAGTLTRAGTSLVNSQHLITKIYFPRMVIPLSAILAGLPDACISFVVFLGLMLYYGVAPTWGAALLPVLLFLTVLTALGVGLWLSALNVRYRDVNHLLPFLVQVWMYASPVVYPVSLIPERWQWVYGLNPMAGVIEAFRWSLLGKAQPSASLMWASVTVILALLLTGALCFRRMEDSFADII